MTTTMVKHCESKGRGRCGRRAVSWVVITYDQFDAKATKTIAVCAKCLMDDKRITSIVGPIETVAAEVA